MNHSFRNTCISRLFSLSLLLAALFAASTMVSGQTITFAQFFELNGSQDFFWTNNAGANGSFATIPGGSPIYFTYQNIVGLDPQLQGIQLAHLTITTTSLQPGSLNGSTVTQPFDQVATVEITRDTPTTPDVGGGNHTLLLRAVFTPAANTPGLVGSNGGNSATLSATTPDHSVTFSSHFVTFIATTQRNMALSFSSVTPGFSLGLGGFLQDMTAAGSGTFASNPVPTVTISTAAGVSVGGRVYVKGGVPQSNTSVTLQTQDGSIRTARTSSFGFFSFDDLTAGQSVIVSVRSKRFVYQPRVISLDDNAADVNFTPEP
ncbi:MAG: hypothetical protein ABI539_05070 [Acidobacteriota bacterium]